MSKDKNPKYNLEDRTAKFGENIIKFCKKISRSPITDPLITQLVKAGTSLEQITAKQMMQKVNKILNTKLGSVKKNQENLNILSE